MININKYGWLHKFNSIFSTSMRWEQHSTLCAYFWGTIANIMKALVIVTILLFVAGLAGCSILAPLVGVPFTGSFHTLGYLAYLAPLVGGLALALVIGAFVGLGAAIGWSGHKVGTWVDHKAKDVDIKRPEVITLALEFIKAKKKKYCPLIKIE